MKLVWKLERDIYQGETTLGKLFDHNGDFYCYVLEDVVRAYGIKDKTNTAIPATGDNFEYIMRVMPSGRYGEAVTILTDVEDGVPVLKNGGIKFSYIRCHGGNDHQDSEGCLLVNEFRDPEMMKAWGSMMRPFTQMIKDLEEDGNEMFLKVINKPQSE